MGMIDPSVERFLEGGVKVLFERTPILSRHVFLWYKALCHR